MQVVKPDRGNYSTDHPPSELADLPSRSALQKQESSASSCPELRQVKQGELESAAARLRAQEAALLWGAPGFPERGERSPLALCPPRSARGAQSRAAAPPGGGSGQGSATLRLARGSCGEPRPAGAQRGEAPPLPRGTYRGPPWSGAGGEGAAARPSHRRRSEEAPHPLRPLPRPRHGHGTRDTAPGSSRPRLPPAAPPAEPGTGLPMPGRASPFRDPAGLCPQQGNCLFQLLQSHDP